MSKQSKNRVKLNKQYKSIGKLPIAALNKINEFMDLPVVVRDIRSSENNMVKHNHRHIDELEEQLNQLGITKEGYAEFVAKNYNQIRLGNKPLSLILAVLLENINHIAAVHLHYDKNGFNGQKVGWIVGKKALMDKKWGKKAVVRLVKRLSDSSLL